jgi:hypothetical protein
VSIGRRLGDALGLVGTVVGVAYGAWLLFVGSEVSYVTPEGAAGTMRSPTLAGMIPLLIGLLAGWAAIVRRPNGLWVAAGLAVTSSMLFLFSFSVQFALLAALLLVAAALSSMPTRANPRR